MNFMTPDENISKLRRDPNTGIADHKKGYDKALEREGEEVEVEALNRPSI